MSNTIPTIITVSALAIALGACTPEQRMSHRAAPGSYDSTETSTDDKGTTTVRESTTVVSVDEYGNRKETVTSKTSRDPKGLMNKTSKKTQRTTEDKY
jgi:major membrane immunogen (membrane-anchored lipoprotein)